MFDAGKVVLLHIKKVVLRLISTLLVVSPLLLTAAGLIASDRYIVPLDETNWRFAEDKYFKCTLSQHVPLLGEFSIVAEAGYSLFLQIDSSVFKSTPDYVNVKVYRPYFLQSSAPVNIPFSMLDGSQYLRLLVMEPYQQLVEELNRGGRMVINFISAAHNRSEGSYEPMDGKVVIPLVNMSIQLGDMSRCVNQLLLRDFRKTDHFELHYSLGQRQLSSTETAMIEDLAFYVKADSEVTGITLDGHTDYTDFAGVSKTVSRLKNLDLSKKRAEGVKDVLMKGLQKAGVKRPVDVRVRYHGARYPVASNSTTIGRYRNRRVEVNIKKRGVPEPEDEELITGETEETEETEETDSAGKTETPVDD